ncbi:Site-specific recombinase XerD [Desulfonatronum zhilinae]|nr:Site-specific recombinase XerD [Desulfonatronum zhilinae]
MPKQSRQKTKYAGVYAVQNSDGSRAFYIRYRRPGEARLIEEKAGSSAPPDLMTAAKANQLRTDKIAGRTSANTVQREQGKWTFKRIFGAYIEDRGDSLRGVISDKGRWKNYAEKPLGSKAPSEATTLDMDRIRKSMEKEGLSAQSIKHVFALVKRLLHWGVRKGLIDMPSQKKLRIDMPRVDNEVTEDLSEDQVGRLLAALDEEENQSIADVMRLALVSGMRRGEIFSLQWSDVSLDRGAVTIRNPKGGKTTSLPLNDSALEIIRRQPKRGLHVFTTIDGHRLSNGSYRTLRRIREKAGLPKSFRPLHGLRHAFASRLAASGVDMYVVQKLLTHKSQAMTQRYSHLRDEALKNGAEVGGKVLPLRPAANG